MCRCFIQLSYSNYAIKNTLDAIRTHDLPLRRRLLYPAELPGLGSRGSKQTFGFVGYPYIPSEIYLIIKIFDCNNLFFTNLKSGIIARFFYFLKSNFLNRLLSYHNSWHNMCRKRLSKALI